MLAHPESVGQRTIFPLILCGGAGARLWPVSRESLPKQFAKLFGDRSTFQATVLRMQQAGFARPTIATNRAHLLFAKRQLMEIGQRADILIEPERRDSGPAIVAGCHRLARLDPNALILVVASDHAIKDDAAFVRAVFQGAKAAEAGHFVTFGITPTRPETGYGYIEAGKPVTDGVASVVRFAEKPIARVAADYVSAGLLWNSGNFLFPAAALLDEYRHFDEATVCAVKEALESGVIEGDVYALGRRYADAKAISIDYAVMEKTRRAAVVPVSCGWSDVGTWDALWDIGAQDGCGNVISGDVEILDSSNCLVRTDGQLTSLVGVDDIIVVASNDAVLVADRKRSGEVKNLVEQMRRNGRSQADAHCKVQRPWGWYQVTDSGSGFQVKRIVVHPGGRLSLQKHRYRAEHWVVVRGEPTVTVDSDYRKLRPNEHVHIPLGAVHRLENFGVDPVEIVEVQLGSYLGEDDIVRIEDVYDRV